LEDVAASVVADFDGDGEEEAFVLTGTEAEGVIQGKIFYVTGEGAEEFEASSSAEGDAAVLFTGTGSKITAGSKCFALFEADSAEGPVSVLLGSDGGYPYQQPVYGSGFTQKGDDYLVYQTASDACVLDDMLLLQTVKPYHLYWDEEDLVFYEYGAVEIDRETLDSLFGHPEVLSELQTLLDQESGQWGTILYRDNNTVTVNYLLHSGQGAAGVYGENYYRVYSFSSEGESATLTAVVEEGRGVMLPALLTDIAVYPADYN